MSDPPTIENDGAPDSEPPFGAFATSARQDVFRRLAHHLPANYLGRRFASLLLGPAGGRAHRPWDVCVFGDQKARLHPYDNICEKRVYATPQLWDLRERNALARHIANAPDTDYYFVDVGANVGLYTLFANAISIQNQKALHAICIEPDPAIRARLAFNRIASSAQDNMTILPYAATDREETIAFSANARSRGMGKIDENGDVVVEGLPLCEMVQKKAPIPRIDAMKIDIEGHEFKALSAFFTDAPTTIWPKFLILEIGQDHNDGNALALCRDAGYTVLFTTRMNATLILNHNNL